MGFFENWKEFCNLAERQKLSTACQASFYWIIKKFNDANWAEEIELTDRELMRLTQIRSGKTITDVKSRLKLSGIIDFRTSKYYGTTYKLVQLASTSWDNAQTTAQANAQNKAQASAGLVKATLNTGARIDLKTERPKTRGTTTAAARTREGVGEIENGTPNIKVGQKQNTGVKEKDLAKSQSVTPENSPKFAGEMSSEKNIKFEQREDAKASSGVVKVWIQATYTNPTDLDLKGLAELEKEYGTLKLRQAIIEGNRYKKQNQVNLALVEAILKNGRKKEDEKRDDRKGVSGFKRSAERENGGTKKEGRGGEIEPWDFAGHDNTDYSDAREWVERMFERQKNSGKFE